jgi:uncharacterized hydrophobic protein (TIGR00271 family)
MLLPKSLFNLLEGEDNRDKTLETISGNVTFKGANIWILACAIIVASVGLNVNSTAVIIGAMLISPLMGPIVGAGFALAIFDFTLLRKSLINLFIATVVSLLVSTIYFFITPFKDVQSELLARTAPNIYDILIAFFGGVVGAIAVTRVEKGNPIPGVAIATALMPPLCTAGYGLATGQLSYFLGAFYLYSINCVFIGIATFLIIKYLKYPPKKQVNERQQKMVRNTIWVLVIIMLVPSSYLAYSLYKQQQFKKSIEHFIDTEFSDKGYTVVYKKTNFNSSPKVLELAMLSKRFSDAEIDSLKGRLKRTAYLSGTKLIIRQDSVDRFNDLKGDIISRIESSENEVNRKDIKIMQLEKQLAQATFDSKKLQEETTALFPQITTLSVSGHDFTVKKDSIRHVTAVLYTGKILNTDDKEKFTNWLNKRLSVKDVQVFRAE